MRRVDLTCLLVAFILLASRELRGQRDAYSTRFDLRHGIPQVRLLINQRGPFTFAVDTGTASPAIVSPDAVLRINLRTAGKASLTDLREGPRRSFDTVRLESLEVAGVKVEDLTAIVNKLPGPATRVRWGARAEPVSRLSFESRFSS